MITPLQEIEWEARRLCKIAGISFYKYMKYKNRKRSIFSRIKKRRNNAK